MLAALLAVLLPLAGIGVVELVRQRATAIDDAGEDLAAAAQQGAVHEREIIAEARALLTLVAGSPQVQQLDAEACTKLLGRVLSDSRDRYSTMVATDGDGQVVCSADPDATPVDTSDTAWFQRTAESRDFVLGESRIGRISGLPIVVAAQPIESGTADRQDGTELPLVGVVAAGLRLDWLAAQLPVRLESNNEFAVFLDGSGNLLAAVEPGSTVASTTELPFDATVALNASSEDGGATVVEGDDESWLVARTTLPVPGSPHLLLATPLADVLTPVDREFRSDLLSLLAVGVLASLLALVLVESGVVRPLGRVASVAAAFERGDLTARAPETGASEVRAVAAGLNRAGAAISDHQQRRQELLAQVVDASEAERRRLAGDIHDATLQSLIAVSMRLALVAAKSPSPDVADEIESIRDDVVETGEELRGVLSQLRPPALEHGNLDDAIQELLRRHADQELEWSVDASDEQLPTDVAVTMFRVVQEAVTNTLRHAQATTLRVDWQRVDGHVRLRVVDDGLGFDDRDHRPLPGHVGLATMQERVRLLGGELHVRQGQSGGTVVRAWIPVATSAT